VLVLRGRRETRQVIAGTGDFGSPKPSGAGALIDAAGMGPDTSNMAQRAADWFRQAGRDLEQARDSATAGRHEWACFAAQQAAEKAVEALHLHLGQDAWGHVVRMLLEELPDSVTVPEELLDQARVLDAFYIPARYPNGHAAGAPADHYGKLQS
jgi:HEPN domain-containing protein